MTTYTARDCRTMLRRNMLHARRYPALTFSAVLLPLFFLLLFVFVLGGTLGAGLGSGGDRSTYLAYVTPGILVLAVSSSSVSTAVAVNTDLTEGIVARFRTMPVARSAVLVGHVVGSVLQTVAGVVIVLGVAVLIGFRSAATILDWLGVIGLTALMAFAITWIAVALGVRAPNPESASNVVLPLSLLPFLGSAFVPAESMPPVLRSFAEYQPFTPIIETLRGLLSNSVSGTTAVVALAWCLGLAGVGFLWARSAFRRAVLR